MKVFTETTLRQAYRAREAFYRRAAERRAKGEILTESDILEAMHATGARTDIDEDDGEGEDAGCGVPPVTSWMDGSA
jgi:hypothetical protein